MFFRCGVPTDGEARQQIVEHFARERPDDIHPLGGDFRYLSGMWGATSPDGVYWTVLPGPLVIHYSDTTNVVYYDERLRRYVWYARCSAYGRRCIGRAETEDFCRWPLPDLLVWPGLHHHPADDWYNQFQNPLSRHGRSASDVPRALSPHGRHFGIAAFFELRRNCLVGSAGAAIRAVRGCRCLGRGVRLWRYGPDLARH